MRRQRGVVLVIALAILAGLVFLVATIAASQRVALRAEGNRINARQARIAAQAGLQRALAALADTVQDTAAATTGGTTSGAVVQGQAQTQTDEWYTLGNFGDDRFTVGGGSFRLQIVDAGAFVSLNVAPEAELNLLPLTVEQIAAVQDWRETDPTARNQGAKDDYYNALSKPYNAKLRRFDSVDELLDVRYFTPADIWQVNENSSSGIALPSLPDGRQPTLADLVTTDSFAPQLAPGGGPLVNVNTGNVAGRLQQAGVGQQSAEAIQQGGMGYADLGAVLQRVGQQDYAAVLDNVTTNAADRVEGKINLNTAGEAVLMTIPNLTQDLAQAIVQYQSTGFTKLSDLLQVGGFNDGNNLRQFAGYFTVRSSVFLVRVVGESNGTRISLEGVVDTSSGTPRLVKMHEQPYTDMPTRWGWNEETTNETVLVDAR